MPLCSRTDRHPMEGKESLSDRVPLLAPAHRTLFRFFMTLHQGDCIRLGNDQQLYQVIGVDDQGDRCWLRRWPLARQGCPVLEMPLHQVQADRHRPHPPAQRPF
ncbi:MAG: hypothetical protein VKJ44_04895 [Synechococcus sp.]|nr:hypothetical protein [Synechococcus sp.]